MSNVIVGQSGGPTAVINSSLAGVYEAAKQRGLDIGYFFYIGGNDSMDTICKLSEYGKHVNSDIRFMGVPKTIDNDLMITDHTPGYGSAAKYIGVVMKEIIRDATVYGTKSVTIVEINGKKCRVAHSRVGTCKGRGFRGSGLPRHIYLPE